MTEKEYTMNSTTDSGITIATSAAQFTPTVPTSLTELLLLIDRKTGTQEGMLHAVATRFLEYVGLTGEAVSIEMLHDQKESFMAHLKAGKYKISSVRSYRNYLNMLLRRAGEAGWVRPQNVLPSEWQVVADVMPRRAQRSILSFCGSDRQGPRNPLRRRPRGLAPRTGQGRSLVKGC